MRHAAPLKLGTKLPRLARRESCYEAKTYCIGDMLQGYDGCVVVSFKGRERIIYPDYCKGF